MKQFSPYAYAILIFSATIYQENYAKKTSSKTPDPINISQFCELVHERTYYLLRLKRSITFLKGVQEKKPTILKQNNLHQKLKNPTFKHPLINEVVTSIKTTKNLLPLLELWEHLQSYQMIEDELLLQEFTKLTLGLSAQLVSASSLSKKDTHHHNPHHHSENILLKKGTVYTEAMTQRSYLYHRISRAITYLPHLPCIHDDFFKTYPFNPNKNNTQNKTPFNHKQIKCCINKIKKIKNLCPLQELALGFKRYRFLQDEQFTKEFLSLIFLTYHNMLAHTAVHTKPPKAKIALGTLETIVQIYETIEALPIEEILGAIDDVLDILEEYEFSSEISWQEWLKKYWWVPPIILGTIGIKLIMKYKFNKTWAYDN